MTRAAMLFVLFRYAEGAGRSFVVLDLHPYAYQNGAPVYATRNSHSYAYAAGVQP